jgi:hypothetical protein
MVNAQMAGRQVNVINLDTRFNEIYITLLHLSYLHFSPSNSNIYHKLWEDFHIRP